MTAALQSELDLSTPEADRNIQNLVEILDEKKTWLTAADLLEECHWPATDGNKRRLRIYANASGGKIISGQNGYRHIRHATPEETIHAANWLEHQAKEMALRAAAIRRTFHQLPHTPKP